MSDLFSVGWETYIDIVRTGHVIIRESEMMLTSLFQVILIDDLADTCFTLLNAVTQLVRVGGAKTVHVFVTHAVMSQMPQDLFCCPELVKWEAVALINCLNCVWPGWW